MILSLCIIVMMLLMYYWYRRPKNSPPGPRGLPVLGMIPFLTRRPEIKFSEWSKKYGSVMSVRVGQRDWVVLNTASSIKEAMIRKGDKLVGRPSNHMIDQVLSNGNSGIVFSNNDRWKTLRKFGEGTLRDLGVGKSSFEINIMSEVNHLICDIEPRVNEPYDIRSDISNAIHRIMCSVLFGEKSKFKVPISDYKYLEDPYQALLFNMSILLPFLRFLPPVAKILRKRYMAKYESHLDHVPYLVENEKDGTGEDVISFADAFAREKKSESERLGHNLYFTRKQFLHYVGDMFGAGTHTTTSGISWLFLGLLHYPCYQEKVRTEINEVIGIKKPFIAARNSMPLTMAYIHEILRYCTLTPLAIPHCTKEDVTIEGYEVVKGTHVVTNIWSAHNDQTVFEKPEQFRPERFIGDNGEFNPSKNVIPFSVGPRHCMGEQLARMEMFLFLVSILQKFRIDQDKTSDLPGLDDGVLGIVYLPKPYKIVFTTV